MNTELRQPLTHLPAGSMLHLCDGRGRAVMVFEGQVWITQDNDPRDFVLGAGESFSIDREGLTLVEALHDSKLLLLDAGPAADSLPSSYVLEQQARAQRSAQIAAWVRHGFDAASRFVADLFAHLRSPGAAPRPVAVCAPGR